MAWLGTSRLPLPVTPVANRSRVTSESPEQRQSMPRASRYRHLLGCERQSGVRYRCRLFAEWWSALGFGIEPDGEKRGSKSRGSGAHNVALEHLHDGRERRHCTKAQSRAVSPCIGHTVKEISPLRRRWSPSAEFLEQEVFPCRSDTSPSSTFSNAPVPQRFSRRASVGTMAVRSLPKPNHSCAAVALRSALSTACYSQARDGQRAERAFRLP
jgi:hypothetical protein